MLFSKLITLLVSVCESSKSTSVASDTAVFSCASVDVTVLLAKFIPLLVSVCDPVRVAIVLSTAKVTLFVPVVVSIPVPPSRSNTSESKSMAMLLPLSADISKSSAVSCVST